MAIAVRIIAGFVLGCIAAVPAVVLAIFSAGSGHGTYLLAKLLFPLPLLLTRFTENGTITNPIVCAALAQFPLYGVVIALGDEAGDRLRMGAILLGLHFVLAMACLGGAVPNFS